MDMEFWDATFPKAESLAIAGLAPYEFAVLSRWKLAFKEGFLFPFSDKRLFTTSEALEERGLLIVGAVGHLVLGMSHQMIVAVGKLRDDSQTFWGVNVTKLFPPEYWPPGVECAPHDA
jgi:hypothetical protein